MLDVKPRILLTLINAFLTKYSSFILFPNKINKMVLI